MAGILKVGLVAGLNPIVAPYIKAAIIRAAAEAGRTIELIEDTTELRKDAASDRIALGDHKITALESVYRLQEKGCRVVMLDNLRSELYLDELQTEVTVPLVSLYSGAAKAVKESGKNKIGLLGCAYPAESVAEMLGNAELISGSLESCIHSTDINIVRDEVKLLMDKGAEILLPCCGRIAAVVPALLKEGYPVIDIFSLAARQAVINTPDIRPKPFKIGMIGGLGPAATVDLYDKIVRFTPAKNDQEHIKVVVEQNPQIPDRTRALLENGSDPTLAMYGCARRLERSGCDAIIIPCNTAHSFLPYLERHVGIPFLNMQLATMQEIRAKLGDKARIGLLATSGTVKARIYSDKADEMGIPLFTPDEINQTRVMDAIYGPEGAKAGFTEGKCRIDLITAAEYLVREHDCNCLILGCTELPLILDECDDFEIAGKSVAVIDPTSALARKVVSTAQEAFAERGVR